jgi:hypothetical protein
MKAIETDCMSPSIKFILLLFIMIQSNNINEAFQITKFTQRQTHGTFSNFITHNKLPINKILPSFQLHAKRRKNEKPEDVFNNHWYDEVDSKATPDDVFWEEMQRQKSAAGIVPQDVDDPLRAISTSSEVGNSSSNRGSKWTVMDGSMGRNMGSSSGSGLGNPLPQRTTTGEKSTDAVLASFSAHMVDDNWLDEEYIEEMRMMEEAASMEMDLEEQDLLLDKQIEEWENDEDSDDITSDDFVDKLSGRSNEPWDYYRPDGVTLDEDEELDDDEDQNTIKIDLVKG